MREKKYRVCLSVPLGERSGILTLRGADGKLDGWLEVMQRKNPCAGTITPGGQLALSGRLQTLISSVPYTATGIISGRRILLNLKTSTGTYYPVSGEELEADDEIL